MVATEEQRDQAQRAEKLARRAKSLSVDLALRPASTDPCAHDFRLIITNDSEVPQFKVRARVIVGGVSWGPQLLGNLSPGQEVEVYARINTQFSAMDTDAEVRFVDIYDDAWVATARNSSQRDTRPIEDWIAEGASFAQRDLSLMERGQVIGIKHPDFDLWIASYDG